MVIRLVAQGNLLCSEFLETLAINVHATRGWSGWYIVLKYVAHVVEQSGSREQ